MNENALPLEHVAKSDSSTESNMILHTSELKSKLFALCLEYLHSFGVDEQYIIQFDEHMVDVHWKNGAVHGVIVCILCKHENNKKKKNAHSVRYYESAGSNYWVLSNFKKHLEKMHNLVSILPDLLTKQSRQNRLPLKELKEENGLKNDTSIEYIEVPIIDSQDTVEEVKSSIVQSITDNSVCEKSINTQNEWLYKQLSKQITDMVRVVLVNSDVTSNLNLNFQMNSKW